jgi:hypothetical protein
MAGCLWPTAATTAFLYPTAVAVDAEGNLYVADTGNHVIRKVDEVTNTVTTLAGTGASGFTSDGAAETARLASPRGIAVDSTGGKVLVADTGNHRIRLIFAGNVFALAGDGSEGFLDGQGISARFASPTGIALDADGVAYVADTGNHRIRRIETDGSVSTPAGSGTAGTVNSPEPGAGLYPATTAQFDAPSQIAIDAAGRLFITRQGIVRALVRAAVLPSVTVTPSATRTGERPVVAEIPQPLLPGTTYYFRSKGSNYRATVIGEILAFLTPQAAITLFAGDSTAADALAHAQLEAVDFGSTPEQPTDHPVFHHRQSRQLFPHCQCGEPARRLPTCQRHRRDRPAGFADFRNHAGRHRSRKFRWCGHDHQRRSGTNGFHLPRHRLGPRPAGGQPPRRQRARRRFGGLARVGQSIGQQHHGVV